MPSLVPDRQATDPAAALHDDGEESRFLVQHDPRTTRGPCWTKNRDDEIIPFDQGLRLFEVASEPKQFLELRGGHNDGFLVSGQRYLDGLDAFVAASLGK